MDRRSFLISAGILAAASRFSIIAAANNRESGSEALAFQNSIIPAALVKDAARLVLALKGDSLTVAALTIGADRQRPGNAAVTAAYYPPSEERTLELADQLRAGAAEILNDSHLLFRMVYLLGSMTGISVEKHLVGAYEAPELEKDKIVTHPYDVLLLERYIISGNSTEDVQNLFATMHPRFLSRLHTIKPDYVDGNSWPERMSEWRRQDHLSNQELAAALAGNTAATNSKKNFSGFYDSEDSLLQLVQKQIEGGEVSASELEQSLRNQNSSQYAKALRTSVQCKLAVLDYIEHSISREQLRDTVFA